MKIKQTYLGLLCLAIVLLISETSQAQKLRFIGDYPLATPQSKESDMKVEYEKTITSMIGGVRIMAHETTPTKREDPEAFIRDDYRITLDAMSVYATEICGNLGTDYGEQLKKISKSIKSGKYQDAITALENIGGKNSEGSEQLFFIWKEYLEDQKAECPWTNPKNKSVTRIYRSMLEYVSKNYDRPFGAHAEQGAIVADAAQALSNCMENPSDLAWKGEYKMNMREEDELRRLASNVAYFNWRMHDRISGKRSAHINPEVVRNLHYALYDVVETTIKSKDNWTKDAKHGNNLLKLFEDTNSNGWSVNGDKAQKRGGKAKTGS